MEETSGFTADKRPIAVVTGANKGIGFELCKQLASNGMTVVLTSRDERRGLEAVEKLNKDFGLADNIIFHLLDVSDPTSIDSLAEFIRTRFGRLDILVNNAGILGVMLDSEALRIATELAGGWPLGADKATWDKMAPQTYELAVECLKSNYHGMKRVTESLLPLLQLSDSPKIVNVSSAIGLLQFIPSERIKATLNDVEKLKEETIDEILQEFLSDFKEDGYKTKGWPFHLSAYTMSKAAMNAYTRILAKKYPMMQINAVMPGYVRTDIIGNNGVFSAAEGAEHIARVALLPKEGPTGVFFYEKEQISYF